MTPNVWAWSLTGDRRLSPKATETIETAQIVSVSAISLYEIGQKVRLGKWPEMEPYFLSLIDIAEEQGVSLLPVSPLASLAAADFRWAHRDPFDRIIGASAIVERIPLVSADSVFDVFSQMDLWPGRIW